jgi:hypothetical protein
MKSNYFELINIPLFQHSIDLFKGLTDDHNFKHKLC